MQNPNIKRQRTPVQVQTILLIKLFARKVPWRKSRIEIHSESIRIIPIHSDICIRANSNYSEPIRKTFCISFDEIPNEYEPIRNQVFNPDQSESIQARIDPNRMNPKSE